MDVDAAMRRQFENLGSQDLPVRGDDDQVGMQLRQSPSRLRRPETWRLKDREAETKGGLLHRRGGKGPPAASRPIRLGQDADQREARGQRLEGGQGELGRPQEHDPHNPMVAWSTPAALSLVAASNPRDGVVLYRGVAHPARRVTIHLTLCPARPYLRPV